MERREKEGRKDEEEGEGREEEWRGGRRRKGGRMERGVEERYPWTK